PGGYPALVDPGRALAPGNRRYDADLKDRKTLSAAQAERTGGDEYSASGPHRTSSRPGIRHDQRAGGDERSVPGQVLPAACGQACSSGHRHPCGALSSQWWQDWGTSTAHAGPAADHNRTQEWKAAYHPPGIHARWG